MAGKRNDAENSISTAIMVSGPRLGLLFQVGEIEWQI